jgi:hypothetical protein
MAPAPLLDPGLHDPVHPARRVDHPDPRIDAIRNTFLHVNVFTRHAGLGEKAAHGFYNFAPLGSQRIAEGLLKV